MARTPHVFINLSYKCASSHKGVPFFSTSGLPKVTRTRHVFNILRYKCASRQNGVQFFMSHLARWRGADLVFLCFVCFPEGLATVLRISLYSEVSLRTSCF